MALSKLGIFCIFFWYLGENNYKVSNFMKRVVICGVNTADLPNFSGKEMASLMTRLKSGDLEARELFISGNMRLVLSIVSRFSTSSSNIDDIFQVGCVGLMKAMDNFDEGFNVKFSTYAVPMIIGEIRRYLREGTCVRVSRSLRDIAYKVLLTRQKYSKMGKDISIDDIAKDLGLPVIDVLSALDAIADPVSLYEPVYNDGIDTVLVMEQLSDNKNTCEELLENVALKEAMEKLGTREKEILRLRYFLGKTQTEISESVGISQAQVSRLEKNALEMLKKSL